MRKGSNFVNNQGYDWTLNDDAYHIRCSAQHTPDSNHVCIHENQGEILSKVVDGADQAAWSRTPSVNFTPAITSASSL